MSNNLLTLDVITKEAMRLLHNSTTFSKGVNRQYDNQFAQEGAMAGTSIRVRLPARYHVSDGANMVTQDHKSNYANLTVDQQKHVGVSFTSVEQTMSLDNYSNNVLAPAISTLASKIDLDGLAAAKLVYNSVGTPGTTPSANSTTNNFIQCGTMLNRFATPADQLRRMILNPDAEEKAQTNAISYYNPQNQISDTYRNGVMGRAHGFEFAMDQNVNSFTCGTRANGTINGANQTGATLNVIGAGNATTFVIGDSFTIANVFSVNPENQQSTGSEQQFTVTANATCAANGSAALSITPSIVVAAANVANGTVAALPANGAALTHIGAAGASAVVNVAHHRDAFILGMADLEMPMSGKASRAQMDGMSLRIWKDSTIATDSHPCRIDVLYGWKLVRPEMACKLFG